MEWIGSKLNLEISSYSGSSVVTFYENKTKRGKAIKYSKSPCNSNNISPKYGRPARYFTYHFIMHRITSSHFAFTIYLSPILITHACLVFGQTTG
jgi:hypothetical protein